MNICFISIFLTFSFCSLLTTLIHFFFYLFYIFFHLNQHKLHFLIFFHSLLSLFIILHSFSLLFIKHFLKFHMLLLKYPRITSNKYSSLIHLELLRASPVVGAYLRFLLIFGGSNGACVFLQWRVSLKKSHMCITFSSSLHLMMLVGVNKLVFNS